jgi:hypothetical protein
MRSSMSTAQFTILFYSSLNWLADDFGATLYNYSALEQNSFLADLMHFYTVVQFSECVSHHGHVDSYEHGILVCDSM